MLPYEPGLGELDSPGRKKCCRMNRDLEGLPRRGKTRQPRAAPWVSEIRTIKALKGRNKVTFPLTLDCCFARIKSSGAAVVTRFQRLSVYMPIYPGRCPGLSCLALSAPVNLRGFSGAFSAYRFICLYTQGVALGCLVWRFQRR